MRKVYQLTELKLDGEGEGTFEAAFIGDMRAIDHDGDSYDPGAVGEQDVVISTWNHGSWGAGAAALPIGIGHVFERGYKAIVQGEFDMEDADAIKHYRKLKYLHSHGRNVEWSFALPDADWRLEQRDNRDVRVFTRIDIPETSPVLLGAGVDTELISIKGQLKRAIPSHSTATTDAAWDGAAAMRHVASERAALRAICAWVDPEGDPNVKTSYKFPHHARPGAAANLRACSAGIAALNGGRGGASIPDADRRGVYNHLARHIRDGGNDVPELRSMDGSRKRLTDHIDETVETVERLTRRCAKVKALRDEQGKSMSAAAKRRLQILSGALRDASAAVDDLLTNPNAELAQIVEQSASLLEAI